MKKLVAFLKKLPIARFAIVSLLGAMLLVTTACNSGNEVGARPNNLPVQMGGQNNPHKMGGDGYTKYNTSPNPISKQDADRASLPESAQFLIASNEPKTESDDFVLYPASGEYRSAKSADEFFSPEKQAKLAKTRQNPDEGQPKVTGNANPNGEVLDKAGETFKDASGFLGKPADDSYNRSGLE
ncbi:hypothetical protein IFO70_15905 [Phormidium tenue FACHB-886]|nr:hypothetical protein [Phormidium tenue FACHB-886]